MRPLITVTADAVRATSRGRLLVLGWAAAFAFACVQRVAAMRVIAEMRPDALARQAIAGVGWLIAFLPWVLRSSWIYLTPRADGNAG